MDVQRTEAVFGRWLRQRRRSLDLTQKALAREVGCSPATIRKLEADERRPSRHVAGALAGALGVPEDERDAFVRFARAGWADRPPEGGTPENDRPWLPWSGGHAAPGAGDSLPKVPVGRPAAPPRRERTGAVRSRAVGRETELQRLHDELARALAGAGRAFLVAGEAGQGKTTLLTSFAEGALAAHPELLVVRGACNAYAAGGDPFQPFREVLQELTGGVAAGDELDPLELERGRRLERHAPTHRRLLMETASVLAGTLVPAASLVERMQRAGSVPPPGWLVQRAATPPGHEGVGGGSHTAVRAALTSLVTGVSDRAPLLVLLDDLQWVDESSADALLHLSRSAAGHPLLLLGAFRPSDIAGAGSGPRHVMRQVLHEVERAHGGAVLDLDGADGRAFLDAWLDTQPNRLDEAFREALLRQTGGQPLFTVELLRAMQERAELIIDEDGRWAASDVLQWGALPDRVAGVLAERIDRLDVQAREVLRVASVEGEVFTTEVVADVLGRDPRSVTRLAGEELHRRRGLIVPLDMRRGASGLVSRYRFRHNLIQRFVYDRIDEAERAYLHEAAGDALERLLGDDAEPVALAEHFVQARAPHRAAPHLRSAGDRARMSGALTQAVRYYRSSLESWTDARGSERAAVMRDLGECECMRGNLDAAREALEQARALFLSEGERRLGDAVLALLGHVMYERQDYAGGLAACAEAIDALDDGSESPELAMALSMRALLLMMTRDYERSLEVGSRALDLATRVHAEDARVRALLTVGTVLSHGPPEQREEGLAMLGESFREADRLGVEHFASASLGNLGVQLASSGRIEEGRETLRRGLDYARERGIGLHEAWVAGELWRLAWLQGRWRDALAWEPRLRELASDTATLDRNRVIVPVYLASAWLDLGMVEWADAVFQDYGPSIERVEDAAFRAAVLRERLRLAVLRGDTESADGLGGALVRTVTEDGPRPLTLTDEVLTACKWLAHTRHTGFERPLAACVAVLERGERLRGERVASSALAHARAVAAESRGDLRTAGERALEAAEGWRTIGFALDQVRALALAGRALARCGKDREASAAMDSARGGLDRLYRELPRGAMQRSFDAVRRGLMDGTGFLG